MFLCSQTQVFSQKHSHDLSEVFYGRTVHVLLGVVQRVPELREGRGDDVKHGDAYREAMKRYEIMSVYYQLKIIKSLHKVY